MIRSESEYRAAYRRIEAEKRRLAEHEAKLQGMGFSPEEVARGMAPLQTFHQQFVEQVNDYERIKQGDLSGFRSLHDIGRLLVAVRIASKMSQRAFAERIGVSESQVSRDERNEYNSVSLERACEILEVMNMEVSIQCASEKEARSHQPLVLH